MILNKSNFSKNALRLTFEIHTIIVIIMKISGRFKHRIALAASVCLLLGACLDKDDYTLDGVEATPNLLLPLASGLLGVEDFLPDGDTSLVHVDANGLVYLSYGQTLHSQDISDLLTFPDKSFLKSVPLPPAAVPPSATDQTYATLSTTIDFGLDPEKLSEMLMKGGRLRVSTTLVPFNLTDFRYEVRVELPDVTLNNVPFSIAVSNTPVNVELKNYRMLFNDNITALKLTVIQKAHTDAVVVPAGAALKVDLDFSGMDYTIARGFMGDQTANIPSQTIDVDAFDPLPGAEASFVEPRIAFEVLNSYGIPVNVNFLQLEARKKGQAPLVLQLDKTNPIAIGFPIQPRDSSKTVVNVLNAKDLLDFNPDQFYYRINARINQGLTTGDNFCEDVSELRIRFKADLPLYGHASNIVLGDTVDLDLEDVDQSDIEDFFIRAKIRNDLPLEGTLQFYLIDKKNHVMDSIFTTAQSALVKGSTVNAAGELVSPGVFDQEFPIEKSKIDKLFKADRLIIRSRMNTVKAANGTQPDVQFKASYKMDVKLGIRATLNVKADL